MVRIRALYRTGPDLTVYLDMIFVGCLDCMNGRATGRAGGRAAIMGLLGYSTYFPWVIYLCDVGVSVDGAR